MSQGANQPPSEPGASGAPQASGAAPDRDRALIDAARAQAAASPVHGDVPRDPRQPRDAFPGYDLVHEIHRGGQGTVWLAIQLATKRRVAIKVMHAGASSGSSGRARFEREVQILGQLHHPNIVAIHDSGIARDGSFYYVMDYISGRSLDDEISRVAKVTSRHERPPSASPEGRAERGEPPPPTDRAGDRATLPAVHDTLTLFAKICEAVSAAHMRGVIHRDLKPANIRLDASGEPIVVDFGLAKVALSDVAEGPEGQSPRLMSMTGQFIGSMPWASPEQAEGRPEQIDVRTDVYSLGVILYQMLTGRFPYAVIGNMRDVLDNILRAEPARPSTIRRQINDEIETIVLKCLSKEKERRYQSAGELARDIHRYLRGEPIEAKRDSGWYVLTKTLRRHKGLLAALVGVAILITGFSIAMSLSYARARAAERSAHVEAERAKQESQRAKTEATKARQIQDFLTGMLTAVHPLRAQGQEPTVRDVLDAAAARVETDLADQPLVLASVQDLVGELYFELGRSDQSERHFRSALSIRERGLAPNDPDVARSLVKLAWLKRNERKYDEAESLLKRALATANASPDFPPDVAASAHLQLARVYDQLPARRAEAEALFKSAISLVEPTPTPTTTPTTTPTNPNTNPLVGGWGGDRESRRIAALARWHLGKLLIVLKRPDEATPLFDQAIAIFESQSDRLTKSKVMLDLALLQRDRKEFPAALATCRAAIEVMGQVLSTGAASNATIGNHPDLLAARSKLGAIHFAAGDFAAAADEFRAITDLASGAPQAQNRAQSWIYRASLGASLRELGRYDDAERELLATYQHFATTPDFPDERTRSIERLIKLYELWNRPSDAAKYKAMLGPTPK